MRNNGYTLLAVNINETEQDRNYVWNLFNAANATNAVCATVRTGGPYARLFMRGASYALFTVGGCDVVCEASLQYQNADASSFLLMILRQRFDEYFIDEYMHSTIAHLNS